MAYSLFARSALIACLLPAFAFGQDVARMDEVVQSYVPDRFMGTVLVARGDEILLDKAYGFANLEWNLPHTTETRFRIGSMTKQFTAAAILLLEEQGMLKTSDLLSAHMPDTPEAWKDITLHHLLSHQAGLSDFAARPDFGELMLLPTTAEKTIALFRDLPLDFAPGSAFRYSNSNYVVLGHLIERLSGATYADFLQQHIFGPLGMANSGYDSNTALISKRAAGYAPAPAGLRNAYYVDTNLAHGGGALYSTTGDLLRWSQALFEGELLSTESLAKMTTPNLEGYGYGLTIMTTDKGTQIWHNGSINGFSSMMVYYPDESLLLVGLSNIRSPDVDTIVAHLDALAHGQPVILHSERKEISLPGTFCPATSAPISCVRTASLR